MKQQHVKTAHLLKLRSFVHGAMQQHDVQVELIGIDKIGGTIDAMKT